MAKTLRRLKIWQWAILTVVIVIVFAALRPEPLVFDASPLAAAFRTTVGIRS